MRTGAAIVFASVLGLSSSFANPAQAQEPEQPLPAFDEAPEQPLPAFEEQPEEPVREAEPAAAKKPSLIESKGAVHGSAQAYFQGDENPVTDELGAQLSVDLELALTHKPLSARARLYARADAADAYRSRLLPLEAWTKLDFGFVALRAGLDVVTWSVLDTFRPADTLNARDLDSHLLDQRKLGEPMLAVELLPLPGMRVTFYYLPFVVLPRFTSPSSRFHFAPTGIDPSKVSILTNVYGRFTTDTFQPQAALSIEQTIDSADFGLYALHSIDRAQPYPVADALTLAPALLHQTVTHVAANTRIALGTFILRAEVVYRRFWPVDPDQSSRFLPIGEALGPVRARFGDAAGQALEEVLLETANQTRQEDAALPPDRTHGAGALGLEYGFDHYGGQSSNVFVEATALYGPARETARDTSPFQFDVFLGYRLAFNNVALSRLLVGAIVDVERGDELLLHAAYGQALAEVWSAQVGFWGLFAPPPERASVLGFLRRADHAELVLTRYF